MKKIKVFAEVGSHKMSFVRLLQELDRITADKNIQVVAQQGYTEYSPQNYKASKFFSEKIHILYSLPSK